MDWKIYEKLLKKLFSETYVKLINSWEWSEKRLKKITYMRIWNKNGDE